MIKHWYNRYFACPEAFILISSLSVLFLIILLLGNILAPIFAAVVCAFLLDSIITPLHTRLKIPRAIGVTIVYSFFLGALLLIIFVLLPLVWRQFASMVNHAPDIIHQAQAFLRELPELYPEFITPQNVEAIISYTNVDADNLGSVASLFFTYSMNSLTNLMAWMVYVILIPLVTLFLLKDKYKMIAWVQSFLPRNHGLLSTVWQDVQIQLGGYINGKVIELLLVSVATYIGFSCFGLDYSLLLSFIVGLSVMVPYVGMIVITIPVVLVGLWQWGPDITFVKMMLVFLSIQAIDGNVVVPLLYSSAVNLHPIAIIAAVLIFGGLWGFWGLFFAIPLATLVRAVFNAWRHIGNREDLTS
jgi:putative permease